MLLLGPRTCLGDPVRLQPVRDGARRWPLPGDDLEEGLELRAERGLETVHEEPVRLPGRKLDPGLRGPDGPALVDAGGDAVLRAVHLQAHVVAAAVVAGVGDDAERAVR